MRILLLAKNFNPTSGAGRHARCLYDELSKIASVSAASEDYGMKVRFSNNPFDIIKTVVALRRAVHSAEVVHALDVWPIGVFALMAVLGTKKKLFLSGVGTYSLPPQEVSIKRSLMLATYRRAQGVVWISRYTQKKVQERVPFTIRGRVILHGTTMLTSSEAPSSAFRVSANRYPVFITVGEVKERKGQLDSLRGIALLKHEYPNMLYRIVGSRNDTAYVSAIQNFVTAEGLEENVQYIDAARSDADLAYLYGSADIFLLNSNNQGDHFEGFGLVFLEANHFGIPCIGSRDSGAEDAISDGNSGFLVAQKNPTELSTALKDILKDYKKLSQQAKQHALSFSWKKSAQEYLAFYRSH